MSASGASLTKPLVTELDFSRTPLHRLKQFRDWPQVVLFHSALQRSELGRYSYLSADPLRCGIIPLPEQSGPSDSAALFAPLRQLLVEHAAETQPDLPPFQAGLAGLMTYEAGHLFERLPATTASGSTPFPALQWGFHDWVIAWDHLLQKSWLIVQPCDSLRATGSALNRQAALLQHLNQTDKADHRGPVPASSTRLNSGRSVFERLPQLRSNFTTSSYQEAVSTVVEYIRAGDIFQANLSQAFTHPAPCDPVTLYEHLVTVNPATFGAYFDGGDFQVLSASPERFLQVSGRDVETRPIKGTRARHTIPEADLFTRDELRESDKDRAENVMIVDLLRNDLSRVCEPGSIRVPQLCTVETYETVQHLVSEVRGRLRPDCDFLDLLVATFPGGSITGAPKIRAMQIISELEQVSRGPYCGSMFYLGLNGEADSSILIRTLTLQDGVLRFPAGGGITAQSVPADEYVETLHKVEGLLRALESVIDSQR